MDSEIKALLRLPLVRFAPFMAVGMYVAYFCGSLTGTIVIGCSAAVFIYLLIARKSFVASSVLAIPVIGMLFGTAAMLCYVNYAVAPVMKFADRTVVTDILVEEIVSTSNDTQHIIAHAELNGLQSRVRLFSEDYLYEGQSASVEISFRPDDEQWKLYNLANGILLSGELTVISAGDIPETQGLPYLLRSARGYMADVVTQYIPDDTGELALSVMFGMDEGLPEYLSERLTVCGAAHFTAVSGTHFSVFAAIFMGAVSDKRRRYKSWLALVFVPMAVLFFGTSYSVLRAAAMFLIFAAGRLFHREGETLNSLCLAVTVICAISPSAVLDVGFAMSVLGTFGSGVVGVKAADRLIEILPQKKAILAEKARPLIISLGAVICTAPLSVAVFGGVSLAGVFTTVILMPLMGVGMLLVLLLGITGISFFAVPLGLIMKFITSFVNAVGSVEAMWLPMNYRGAVVITVIIAFAVTVWAIGSFRWFETSAVCAAALTVFSMAAAVFVNSTADRVMVVQGDYGTANIIINQRKAVVIVNGTGGGLCNDLQKALRANGVRSIIDFSAPDGDYGCAVMIDELCDQFEIKHISVNDFAEGFVIKEREYDYG